MIFITVSTGHFDPLISMCNDLASEFSFKGQIGSSTIEPVFPYYRTAPPSVIEQDMKDASLVISHGGAGTTSMLLRLKKPNVIIPKQARYGEPNNLQVELAQKWAELFMTVLCLDVTQLKKCILKAQTFEFQFPEFPKLGCAILDEFLGVPR